MHTLCVMWVTGWRGAAPAPPPPRPRPVPDQYSVRPSPNQTRAATVGGQYLVFWVMRRPGAALRCEVRLRGGGAAGAGGGLIVGGEDET